MNEHLSQDQLIGYVCHTLADAQRETMDVHLGTCRACRARLSGQEALGRRVQYSVMDWRRGVSPSPHMTFAAVAPQLRRSRKFARGWTGSKQFVYGAATLAVLVVLVIGLTLYFRDIGQWNAGLVSEEAMYRGGPQRTGVYDVKGPKRSELRWRFTTKGVISAAPTVVDGVAYVVSHDGFLYAVDTQTAQEKWKFDAGRALESTAAVADGTVYFGSGCIGAPQDCADPPGSDDYFYALDLETGQERWRFETGGAIVSSPLFADGLVYFGSEDQHLYALDARTGREKWRFKAEDSLWGSPALADGLIYFGAGCNFCGSLEDTHLYAVDSQTGQERWRFETGGWVESTPAVADGMVYFGSGDHHVYAVEAQTGQERWRFETQGGVQASLAVDAGLVFAASRDQHLYALDSQSGQELWKFESGGLISGLAVADGVVYFVSNDLYAYAVEGQTGRELWRVQVFNRWGDSISPAVGEGVVYFPGANHLYAVGDPQQAELPQGTYVTTITKEDSRDQYIYGYWELKLSEGGRYSFTLGRGVSLPVDEGHYTVSQNQIVFTAEMGSYGQACIDLGAETGTYQWAFDGQALTLITVEDECPGRNDLITAHPWSKMENPLPLGIYVTTITKEDNVRYDVAGTWELTLAEGNRYSFTQMGMPIAEGRYSLTQDQIVFTDEKDYAGECIDLGAETGTYKWAFDGEALTLTTVEDQCPCRNIVNTVHPWLKQE